MKRAALALILLCACTPLFPQSDGDLAVLTPDSVQPGMSMKDVAKALRKHGFTVRESVGMLSIDKEGQLIALILSERDESIVGSITYPHSPLDWAVALHHAAQSAGTVSEAPVPTQHMTSGSLEIRTIDQSDSDGQRQFVDVFIPKSSGMYRMIIRRPNHAAPTVDFEFIR